MKVVMVVVTDWEDRYRIATETIDLMAEYWGQMVTTEIEPQVSQAMKQFQLSLNEMRKIESLLEKNDQPIGVHAQLLGRYSFLFKEMVRMAVLEVRFKVKPRL